MRTYRHLVSAFLLTVVTSSGCAQNIDREAPNFSSTAGPELRWKYETGG
jgi:hypothetical protein